MLDWLDIIARLGSAALIGGIIGLNRDLCRSERQLYFEGTANQDGCGGPQQLSQYFPRVRFFAKMG